MIVGLFIGLVVGTPIGCLVLALMVAGKTQDSYRAGFDDGVQAEQMTTASTADLETLLDNGCGGTDD